MVQYQGIQKYTKKSEFEKSVNSLLGIIEGITIDEKINEFEYNFLESWIDDHKIKRNQHPFNELIPVVEEVISDGIITEEEKEDLTWLCNKLTSAEYFNQATADMQKLHAVLAGISCDSEITADELKGLSNWLNEHSHLTTCWPYDEVSSLVTSVLADQKIDSKEHDLLLSFFGEFVNLLDNKTIVTPLIDDSTSIVGLCAVCPEIKFADSVFCFTGSSSRVSRNEFHNLVERFGGSFTKSLTKKVDYLVIGADGNPCWAYACYGRKVEKAVDLRKKGHSIMIIHENDFHDAIEDFI